MTVDQLIGQYHSLFLYIPIVLFTGALIADLLHYYGKNKFLSIGHWLIIVGVVFCIPTIITGLSAAAGFEAGNYLVEKHGYLGYAMGISGSMYAGLRISAMLWRLPLRPVHYVVLSGLLVALVSWTADYGFLILHSA
ncbi:MAG TPA: DUF2231 domain-containing protein [Parachlamydiaceae bacterium]|nr:DUF2231 domain-containing protein [Parachlamydiaceae bacterium]